MVVSANLSEICGYNAFYNDMFVSVRYFVGIPYVLGLQRLSYCR